jgi:hypothetical protein
MMESRTTSSGRSRGANSPPASGLLSSASILPFHVYFSLDLNHNIAPSGLIGEKVNLTTVTLKECQWVMPV